MMYLGMRDDRYVFLGSEGELSAIEITIALEEIGIVKRGKKGSPTGSLIFGEYTTKRYGKDPETGNYEIGFAAIYPLLREGKLVPV